MFGKRRQARREFERDVHESVEEFNEEYQAFMVSTLAHAIGETHHRATGTMISEHASIEIANNALMFARERCIERQEAKAELSAWLNTIEDTR